MELKLYDTLAREKRVFTPLDPNNVRMYVCGPTVYDFAHIGNARPVIVFDVLFRLLRHLYGAEHVTYVRNITDVDDKINNRAAERLAARGKAGGGDGELNAEIRALTEETYANFKQDVAALGCLPPTFEPRATEFIHRSDGKLDMITLIERLIANGHAYAADGHVLFNVPSMPDYGRLSKRPLDEMIAGARVEIAPYKRDAMDFVLWKPSAPNEPGWNSPWGRGRPGWHIECSAMSGALLGETFDIHGGGIDLVFPHHENEIAQSRCAFHQPVMAHYWMHNGFLMVEGEKMAKSLGNFITIRALLSSWTGPVLRYAMLQTHYRQPINWTVVRLEQARQEIGTWASLYSGSEAQADYQKRKYSKIPPRPTEDIVNALADDLNTPNAVALLRKQFSERSMMKGLSKEFFQNCEFLGILNGEFIGALESDRVSGRNVQPRSLFDAMPYVHVLRAGIANGLPDVVKKAEGDLSSLGVRAEIDRDKFLKLVPEAKSAKLDTATIESLIAARAGARKAKNFAESDRIRDELLAMGVVLKDTKDGTTWEVAR